MGRHNADDDDDCSVIEVYDLIPISYTFRLDTMTADPVDQVIQAAPLLQEQGVVPPRSRRRASSTASLATPAAPSAAPLANPPKAQKKSFVTRMHGSKPKGPPNMPTGPFGQ